MQVRYTDIHDLSFTGQIDMPTLPSIDDEMLFARVTDADDIPVRYRVLKASWWVNDDDSVKGEVVLEASY